MIQYIVLTKEPCKYAGRWYGKDHPIRMPIRDAIDMEKAGQVRLVHRMLDERMVWK